MDSQELLNQLADIRLPNEIGLWPPAPGWWILFVILLIILYAVIKAFSKRRALQYSLNAAIEELGISYTNWCSSPAENKTNALLEYVNTSNTILRRVALVKSSNSQHVASLTGEKWIAFIRSEGDSTMLTEEIASALSQGRFQQRLSLDAEAMHLFCSGWVTSMYMTKKQNKNPLDDQSFMLPKDQ